MEALKDIWVAQGTYKPTRRADNLQVLTPNDRNNAFVLKRNVKLYGGFKGNETTLEQRDIKSNPTILSGDLGAANNHTDNAYHVVISSGDVGTAELNGFTITGGNSNGSSSSFIINGQNITKTSGGGIHINQSSPLLKDLIIINNQSQDKGGGLYIINTSSPIMEKLSIIENQSIQGGGIYNEKSTLTLSESLLSNNTSNLGGGIFNYNNDTLPSRLVNIILRDNTVKELGGAIFNKYAPIQIINTLMANNQANAGGGIFIEGSGDSGIINSTLSNNRTMTKASGLFVHSMSLKVQNTIITGNLPAGTNIDIFNGSISYNNSLATGATSTDSKGNLSGNLDPLFTDAASGNYQLQPGSPVVDKGNNTYLDSSITTDIAGNPRIINQIIDMGAYEYQGIKPSSKNILTDEDKITNLTVNLSPNPVLAGNSVYININDIKGLKNPVIHIYDIMGNLVSTISIKSEQSYFTAPLQKGVYVIRLLSENKVIKSTKLMVN